jgi:transcriptional regulator with XRE-family HTH domain
MGRRFKCRPNPSNKIGCQIARLEKGSSLPSLSFLNRIAGALDVRIDLLVIPRLKFPQEQTIVGGG